MPVPASTTEPLNLPLGLAISGKLSATWLPRLSVTEVVASW